MKMCIVAVIKLFLLCGLLALVECNEGEYYWRPWTPGSPPSDAVTVRDYRGVSYIVEAYVPYYGNYIGQAFANQQQVNVSVSNNTAPASTNMVVRSSTYLKVLCTQNLEKLAWYPANQKTLANELVTAVITPVLGGVTIQDRILYISKVVDVNREVNIGSIIKEYSYYHNAGKTTFAAAYEILVIGGKCKNE